VDNVCEIKVVGSEFEHCSVEIFKRLPLNFVVYVVKVTLRCDV